jgi:outer membrane protein OmpA-like peptidoglycan-associated protein
MLSNSNMGALSVSVVRPSFSRVAFTLGLLFLPAFAQESQQLAEGWDFVPGEKLLLFDDFTDMPKGGSPPHWKVRGASVKLGADGRLILSQASELFPNVASWPKNFTVEHDFAVQKCDNAQYAWTFANAEGEEQWKLWIAFHPDGECDAVLSGAGDQLGAAKCKYAEGQLNRLGLWMQDGRLRLYWNSDRLIDVNQVKSQVLAQVWTAFDPNEGATASFSRVRIAESSPDFSKTILSSGRFVTHGIQFDVNSDRLRPESAPVLKLIASALAAQTSLKVRIEGHTDSTGDAAKNLDLSKRRAESVKKALATQYGIDGARLSTEGFGATKPLGSNDSPQGRAENRRVEFVKI